MAERVCPFWIGYLLLSPLRKVFNNPRKILSPFIKPGMFVLDIGPAMGYFSLPLAKMVGESGKIICVDMQERMLQVLLKRAKKRHLENIIDIHLCEQTSLNLNSYQQLIDFALAFYIVHEVPDQLVFFKEIYQTLKPGGKILVAEPAGHVTKERFNETLLVAQTSQFVIEKYLSIHRSRSAILIKT